MQGDATAKSYSLVFGDTTFSTLILTAYPADDAKTGNEILSSLNTIYYDKSKKTDPFETASFTVDNNASKFKFFQYNANIYVYTLGGVDSGEDHDAPAVLVSQFPKDNTMTTKSYAEKMIDKSKNYGLTEQGIKNVSTEKINGYDTYQAEVYGTIKGSKILFFYCVLTKDDKAILIQGISKKKFETDLQEFEKLLQTIKLK